MRDLTPDILRVKQAYVYATDHPKPLFASKLRTEGLRTSVSSDWKVLLSFSEFYRRFFAAAEKLRAAEAVVCSLRKASRPYRSSTTFPVIPPALTPASGLDVTAEPRADREYRLSDYRCENRATVINESEENVQTIPSEFGASLNDDQRWQLIAYLAGREGGGHVLVQADRS